MGLSRKNTYLLLVLTFVFSSSVGMAGMHADDMGQMTRCPLMGMDSICRMGIFEHIRTFQNMFSGVLIDNIFSSILLLFLVFSLSTMAAIPMVNSPPLASRLFVKKNLSLPDFSRILVALSDGRLQPKLYA